MSLWRLGEVQCRVCGEEVKGSELESGPPGGEHRPVFRPYDMVQSERVPEDDVRVLDDASNKTTVYEKESGNKKEN